MRALSNCSGPELSPAWNTPEAGMASGCAARPMLRTGAALEGLIE
jgi:hypothetical protein